MWAQIVTFRVKAGHENAVGDLIEQLRAAEQPDSGLVRQIALRDQNDASKFYMIAMFESEEKARARENDPRREEGLAKVRATMGEALEGPSEFVDLDVIADNAF